MNSDRQISFRSFNYRAGVNPYTSWAKIVDCGDIAMSPFDNKLALRQMSEAYQELAKRKPALTENPSQYHSKSKLVSLGGDHSIVLPALRALKETYGHPITVLHFDAHLDTWHPAKYPSAWIDKDDLTTQSFFNHGSFFWLAGAEGIIANGSVHAGLRPRLSGTDWGDLEDDTAQGWHRISADDIDDVGVGGVISEILSKIGTEVPVYLSVDIDVIDPGMAPGTGTPEPGGWTTRELIRILRGLEGLNVVGADVVEVSPSYDDAGQVTSLAAAQIVFELVTNMVKRGLLDAKKEEGKHNAKDEL